MLPTHERIADYRGHAIYRRKPGLEYTPVLLGRIASFIARGPGGQLAVFAFMVPALPEGGGTDVGDDDLLAAAADAVRATIDLGPLQDHLELTYEFRDGRFVAVSAPRWWVPTW